MDSLLTYITYSVLAVGLIPLLILFFKYRAFSNAPIVPFVWLTAASSIYEATSLFFFIELPYWFLFYNGWEFFTLVYFFYLLNNKKPKALFAALIILCSAALFITSSSWIKWDVFESNAISSIPTFILVAISVTLWFRNLFKNTDIPSLWTEPNFYFVSGLLIYCSSTFFLFLLSSIIFESKLPFTEFWYVNIIASLILRMLLIVGTWKMKPGYS